MLYVVIGCDMPNPGFFFFLFGQTCEDGVLGVQEEEKTISQIWLHVIGILFFLGEPHYILATS
jgi:hypothetical protein